MKFYLNITSTLLICFIWFRTLFCRIGHTRPGPSEGHQAITGDPLVTSGRVEFGPGKVPVDETGTVNFTKLCS